MAKRKLRSLHPQLSDNPAVPKSYEPLLIKPVLDKTAHDTIVRLRAILSIKQKNSHFTDRETTDRRAKLIQ